MAQLRLLLRVLGFGVFASVFYTVLLTSLPRPLPTAVVRDLNVPRGGYGHNLTRMAEARTWGQVDILFLGSSHAYRGFDTRIFAQAGARSFNLGSSRQTPLQYEVLLKRHLSDLSPRVVIIEVEPHVFMSDGVEGALDLMANGPIDRDVLRLAWRIGHLRTWNALLHNGGKQVLGLGAADVEERRKGPDTYIPGGFVEQDMAYNTRVPGAGRADLTPRAMQLAALDRALAMLQAQGIEVLLVEAPVTSARYASYSDHARFADRMRERATYIDMNGAAELDDRLHFYDNHHLNQRGVELFNAALIDTLRVRGYLPAP
ncbi:MAG: hypothetical protein KIT87_07140 [Anaerolineae bacterium]|nr:hypothetical protein [Anaerolineae bacterium]MCW5898021.1 hypothetical protein [Flavobacteriales bacterium]